MRSGAIAAGVLAWTVAGVAWADQPMTQLDTWSGRVAFFATGAPMAVDGPDADTTQVDMIAQPASVTVTAAEVLPGAILRDAFLYWGGSITNDDCVGNTIDDTVDFTAPGMALTSLTADQCYCSDAGASSYDIQVCRASVTKLVPQMIGTYTVDQFDALINNGSTNNASFSLVLIYGDSSLPPRRIGLWDGVQTMSSAVNPQSVVTLGNLEIDNPAEGDLTWFVMEGDVGGSGLEQVTVQALPSAQSLVLTDALNPATNPMNHTINTTVPPQSDSIGVDIDRFDLAAALTPGDTSVEVTYQAGLDKWWLTYNIMGVNVFEPVFGELSTKDWVLEVDADMDGNPSVGDTIRYTIHLENSGNTVGTVVVDDVIPAEIASWVMVFAGGGMDVSTAATLSVTGVTMQPGQSTDIVFDAILADVPDNTVMQNVATYDAAPEPDMGNLVAPDVVIRRDGDGDGVYDSEDNCPDDPNPDQADADMNGIGDVCDVTGAGGMGGAGGGGGAGGIATPGDTGGGGSAAATGGAGGVMAGTGANPGSGGDASGVEADSGCGCEAPGRAPFRHLGWGTLLALGLLARRRRSATRSSSGRSR